MRISLVTPNYNHARYLEDAIQSVLRAGHGDLEYIVVDGGSTDESHAIIDRYRNRISSVIIEPDDGHYHALNKGFARSTGEIMGWINSSDMLFPNSLFVVNEIFEKFPEIDWITSRVNSFLDEQGNIVEIGLNHGFEKASVLSGETLPLFTNAPTLNFIVQESTFWRRSLWQRAGAQIDCSWQLAADFELWTRFFQYAELWSISAPIGSFRRHPKQLSSLHLSRYLQEGSDILKRLGCKPQNPMLQTIRVMLRKFLPAKIRKYAHALHLFKPAPFCIFNEDSGWTRERL